MAIKGVSLAEREAVILPHDPGHPDNADFKAAIKAGRETEQPTKFIIGNLSRADRIELGDMTTSPTMRDGGVTMEMKRTKRAYAAVERALQGWENMLDANGKPVKFVPGTIQTANGFVAGASEESLAHLSAFDIFALSEIILAKNGITKALEGNSEGALLPSEDTPSLDGLAADAPKANKKNEAA